jgi:hypothetical protein
LTGQGLRGPEPQPSAGSSLVLQTGTQCVTLEAVLSQVIPSRSWKDVSGSASSEAIELGDRLRFSLSMMSEFGTPIYPSMLLSSLEVGESSRGGDFEGVGNFCFQMLGVLP